MTNDQPISQQAHQLWQSYALGLSKADNEQFWNKYKEIRDAARQTQNLAVAKKETTTIPLAKTHLLNKELTLTPQNRRKYKNNLKKQYFGGFLVLTLIGALILFIMYLIAWLISDSGSYVDSLVFMSPLTAFFLLAMTGGYLLERPKTYRYIAIEDRWLITGGKFLTNKKIYLNSINKVETDIEDMTIYYKHSTNEDKSLKIPCLVNQFNELKAYLETVVKQNGY